VVWSAVALAAEEREHLSEPIAAGHAVVKALTHARILLKADAAPGGPARTDSRMAEPSEVNLVTFVTAHSLSVTVLIR
jgi:hypothetical protein